MTLRQAPTTCPVCGDQLHTTRLSCHGCDTELTGHFQGCDYCALSPEDRRLLGLFLSSRGNVKDVERTLGVSYPTARARVDAVLAKLGHLPDDETAADGPPASRAEARLDLLERLARGEVSVDDALDAL